MKTLDMIGIKPSPDFKQLRQALLRDGKPDHVPFYELFVNPSVIERLLGKKITSRADTVEFYYRAGYDYVPVWPGLAMQCGSLEKVTRYATAPASTGIPGRIPPRSRSMNSSKWRRSFLRACS